MTNGELVHRLFYWKENNRYVFSRTKFLTIVTFIVIFLCCLPAPMFIIAVFFALCVSLPVFIIGFLIHYFVKIDSSFYNDNLLEDIKHFLFYWNCEPNCFELSKTKVITVFIIMVGLVGTIQPIIAGGYDGGYLAGTMMAYILVSLFFATIAFFIGFAIHKLISNNAQKPVYTHVPENGDNANINESENKPNRSSKFFRYRAKVDGLKKEFDEKESATRGLVESKFEASQITYGRFMEVIDNCSSLFNQQYESALNLIDIVKDDSLEVDEEIYSKIKVMESLDSKLDEMRDELIIQMSKTKDEEIHNVLDEMENLIDSIDDYND